MKSLGILRLFSKKNIIIFLLLFICSCGPQRLRKVLFGLSPYDVEQAKDKYAETFEITRSECFEKVIAILKEWPADLLYQNKKRGFIVAYGFNGTFRASSSATEVAILIKSLEDRKTKVALSSDNPKLVQFVCEELFKQLTATPNKR